MRRVAIVVLFVSFGVACAQGPVFEIPVLGHAFDAASGSIRPLTGVPGAAWLEAPLPAEEILRQAVVAPGREYALAPGADGLRVVRWSGRKIDAQPVEGSFPLPEQIVFSPSGDSAALLGAVQIQVWRGLPEAPALARSVVRGGAVDALAVADEGTAVALARGGAVVLHDSSGARTVAQLGRVSALAFARSGQDLAIADSERGQVWLAGAALPGEFQDPSALAFSADGRKLAVASQLLSSVVLVDLASRQASLASCECSVETLARVRGNAVFLLTGSAKGRPPLFDGDGAEPRIVLAGAAEEAK
ncbi:MAG: hypothetical protein HY822_18015 [Acidobacteria bacterium]|nr:hypothetical protein [Acidobacteriota bacterium]